MTTKSPSFLIVDYLLGLGSSTLDNLADVHDIWGRMIFRDSISLQRLDGTGKRAIFVTNQPSSSAFSNTTAYGSYILIRCFADHTRNQQGEVQVEDGLDRAWKMFGFLDECFPPVPLSHGNPFIQVDRLSQPIEGFDPTINCPNVGVSYEVAVLAEAR